MILTGEKLEENLESAFVELKIEGFNRGSLNACLETIKGRDIPTYDHSGRVGLKGKEILTFIHHDPKILFYSGILHDFGKIFVNPSSLKKNIGFGDKDKKKLKNHPKDAYRILKEIHPFATEVLLRHHCYQEDPYPLRLPPLPKEFSKIDEVMINYFARLLALTDFYDALTTRKNDRFEKGKIRLPTKKEAKEIMFKDNPDQRYFMKELYKAGIF